MTDTQQIDIMDLIPKPKVVKDKTLPSNVKLKLKESWCPYCSQPVIFIKDKRLGVKKCSICGVSNRDYWVKKVNGNT